MGNSRSTNHCLDSLGIPTDLHKKFKQVVLKYVASENPYGGDLPSASHEDLNQICSKFLSAPEYLNLQYSFPDAGDSSATDTQRHGWVLQLVNNWIGEEKKKQSQEDPSYSEEAFHSAGSDSASSVRKKRKRQSDRSSPTKSTTEKSNKKHQILSTPKRESVRNVAKPLIMSPQSSRQREVAHPPRSPTIEDNGESTQDMDFQDSPESGSFDFPGLNELLAPRPSQMDQSFNDPLKLSHVPTSAKKGKAPVRDPFSATVSLPPSTATDESPTSRLTEQQPASPISPGDDKGPEPKPSRRKTYALPDSDDEDNDAVAKDVPTSTPTLPSFGSSTIQQTSQQPTALLTPPPTVRRTQFAESTMPYAPPDVPHTHNQTSFKARVQDVLDEIQSYIHTCETHSNRIARDASSSMRERQYHHTRAAAFAHLKVDICSRIDAFIERENGGSEDIPITEHCLHYP